MHDDHVSGLLCFVVLCCTVLQRGAAIKYWGWMGPRDTGSNPQAAAVTLKWGCGRLPNSVTTASSLLVAIMHPLYQVLRWQDERPDKRARTSSSGNDHSSSVEAATQGMLGLELQDASQQQAALAVLQSLYVVKPLPELLSDLSQEQQLQAAVLADMWQVPYVSCAAARLLADALNTADGLADAVQQRILQGPPLPDCLQPLLKCVLLSSLGDLEAVWADAGLREQLLGLPLPAMELLLSNDELKVRQSNTAVPSRGSVTHFCTTNGTSADLWWCRNGEAADNLSRQFVNSCGSDACLNCEAASDCVCCFLFLGAGGK
jgi:hypothetical protein